MNEGKTIFDLPVITTIPNRSRHILEMGDGSGTKSVTHEDVVKSVRTKLLLGDVQNLETEAKDNFVNAINELKRLIDLLVDSDKPDAKIKLINNLLTTVSGLGALDAAQGKALNDLIGTVDQRMGGFEFSVSSDGMPMYKPAGADTALPFKRLRLIRSGLSSQYDQTVDVSAVDNNYQKYTSSDFLLTFDAIAYGAITNEADYGGAVSLSYNPATGMMSIPRRKYFFRSGQESWVIYSVYLV